MAGVVKDVDQLMIPCRFQKAFESIAVVQIFAGMYLITDIDALFIVMIQNRQPTFGQFLEAQLYQTGRALRPRVPGMPKQGSGKSSMRFKPQSATGGGCFFHHIYRPFGTGLWICLLYTSDAADDLL